MCEFVVTELLMEDWMCAQPVAPISPLWLNDHLGNDAVHIDGSFH